MFFSNIFSRISDFISSLKIRGFVLYIGSLVIILLISFYIVFWTAPKNFPAGSLYYIAPGQSLTLVAENLETAHVIKSAFWFKAIVFLIEGNSRVVKGSYVFDKTQNVFKVAYRIANGDLELKPIKITVPEGLNSMEIANLFSSRLPSFKKDIFLKKSAEFEGYLFPDTYFVLPDTDENAMVSMMYLNYKEQIKTLDTEIKTFGKTIEDIIKMASILEEEARTLETRRIVSGILWKRISLKMPLQVDAAFKYINGKTTATLSLDDLKIDSPYNTYLYRGFPPTPIANPGLDAILAAITPIKTPYLYFLTDKDGNMHYAKTLAEHVANKDRYLR